MNKDDAHLYLPLVKALAEGKTIQYNYGGECWKDYEELAFGHNPCAYRIKPEPREVWVNCSLEGSLGTAYKSKEAASRSGLDQLEAEPGRIGLLELQVCPVGVARARMRNRLLRNIHADDFGRFGFTPVKFREVVE